MCYLMVYLDINVGKRERINDMKYRFLEVDKKEVYRVQFVYRDKLI